MGLESSLLLWLHKKHWTWNWTNIWRVLSSEMFWGNLLPLCSGWQVSSALKMKVWGSSKTLVPLYQTTRCHIPSSWWWLWRSLSWWHQISQDWLLPKHWHSSKSSVFWDVTLYVVHIKSIDVSEEHIPSPAALKSKPSKKLAWSR
jgi:hypothetical protein